MNLKRFLNKSKKGLDVITLKANASYAQVGEDIIVNYLFNSLNIQRPTYLEIGTNQPILYNNTYFFYIKGSKGVCVEPDPGMYELIKKKRPRDTVINIGIGLSDSPSVSFYLFPGILNAWSTFSESEAIIRETESGIKPNEILIPIKTINDIIEQYFDSSPNFISIDVEGMDLDILKSLDFERFQPEVICVETISFSITNTEKKLEDIFNFMNSKGYTPYADTHVNTIFCRKNLFNIEK